MKGDRMYDGLLYNVTTIVNHLSRWNSLSIDELSAVRFSLKHLILFAGSREWLKKHRHLRKRKADTLRHDEDDFGIGPTTILWLTKEDALLLVADAVKKEL